MPLFKKREESAPAAGPAAPGGVPVDIVMQMRQQGYPNDQIIQFLTDQGYSSSQIFDAMSQADIGRTGGAIEEMPPEAAPEMQPEAYGMPPAREMPPIQPMPAYAPPAPAITKEEVEEIAESIIEEKWTDLMKSVEKIIEWKEAAEAKINKIEQAIIDLKEQFEELHKGILERVSEYDKGIRQVGVNVKAMEEVFKKLLPEFTANVSELSRITKKTKS